MNCTKYYLQNLVNKHPGTLKEFVAAFLLKFSCEEILKGFEHGFFYLSNNTDEFIDIYYTYRKQIEGLCLDHDFSYKSYWDDLRAEKASVACDKILEPILEDLKIIN